MGVESLDGERGEALVDIFDEMARRNIGGETPVTGDEWKRLVSRLYAAASGLKDKLDAAVDDAVNAKVNLARAEISARNANNALDEILDTIA